jgi:LPXTG-motif cell wall-anchored protein
VAVIKGLRFSADNGTFDGEDRNEWAPGDDEYMQYCLVEVATDPDYNLLAEPMPFVVGFEDAVNANLVVKNTMKNTPGWNLPLTGGTGLALVVIVGVALGGTVLLLIGLRRVRERRAEAAASL